MPCALPSLVVFPFRKSLPPCRCDVLNICSSTDGSAATAEAFPAGTCLLSYDEQPGRMSFTIMTGTQVQWSGGLRKQEGSDGGGGSGGGGSGGSGGNGGGGGGFPNPGGGGSGCLQTCNSREACVQGECTCQLPYKRCGYDCVDFNSDAWNCGKEARLHGFLLHGQWVTCHGVSQLSRSHIMY
jgi:hypothetical protein